MIREKRMEWESESESERAAMTMAEVCESETEPL